MSKRLYFSHTFSQASRSSKKLRRREGEREREKKNDVFMLKALNLCWRLVVAVVVVVSLMVLALVEGARDAAAGKATLKRANVWSFLYRYGKGPAHKRSAKRC